MAWVAALTGRVDGASNPSPHQAWKLSKDYYASVIAASTKKVQYLTIIPMRIVIYFTNYYCDDVF